MRSGLYSTLPTPSGAAEPWIGSVTTAIDAGSAPAGRVAITLIKACVSSVALARISEVGGAPTPAAIVNVLLIPPAVAPSECARRRSYNLKSPAVAELIITSVVPRA